jgi:hypothetical protein
LESYVYGQWEMCAWNAPNTNEGDFTAICMYNKSIVTDTHSTGYL